MSRRRGVVHSDDEENTPVQPSRNSHRPVARPSRPSEVVPPQIPDLPNVAKLDAQDLQKVLLIESHHRVLQEKLNNALNIVSDTAVAVEELKDMPQRSEV